MTDIIESMEKQLSGSVPLKSYFKKIRKIWSPVFNKVASLSAVVLKQTLDVVMLKQQELYVPSKHLSNQS